MAAAGALRLTLLWLSRDALADLTRSELFSVAFMGARLDAVFIAYACLPATLVALLSGRVAARFVSAYMALLVGVSVLAHAADLLFFRYYSSRLNYLVLEHGADLEVWRAILRQQIGAGWLAATAAALLLAYALQRRIARALSAIPALRLQRIAPLACAGLALLSARGTLQHRPLNPSAAAVTANRVANEITASGAYNVFYESVLKLQGLSPSLESVVELPGSDEELRLRAQHMVEQRGPLTHDSAN